MNGRPVSDERDVVERGHFWPQGTVDQESPAAVYELMTA